MKRRTWAMMFVLLAVSIGLFCTAPASAVCYERGDGYLLCLQDDSSGTPYICVIDMLTGEGQWYSSPGSC